MPSRPLPNLNLIGFFDLGENGWDDEMSLNLLKLSILVQPVVLSKVAAEPGSPAAGDRHILDETHATHPNEIIVYDDGDWVYIEPEDGWVLFNVQTGEEERLTDGLWMSQPSAIKEYVSAAISTVGGGGEGAPITGIISGLGVVYTGVDLDWAMSAGSFYLDGELLTATAQTLSLDAADPTNPRIDALYVDEDGIFGVITGTPAVAPSQPTVDPATQLFLTFVSVPAAAVDLPDVVDESIYLENAEWTSSTTGGWNADSTADPFAGTKSIEGTALVAGNTVQLDRVTPMSFDGDGNLIMRVKSKGAWGSKRSLSFQWFLAESAVGAPISLRPTGTFGFDSSDTTTDQLIVISKDLFAVPGGSNVDELRIVAAGTGGSSPACFIVNIILQNTEGTTGGSTVSGISQEQADARYLRQSNNLSDINDSAEARDNIGAKAQSPVVQAVASNATVTPAFGEDLVKITAQAAALALANWSGTAIPGWGMAIRIKDNGTARAITYGSKYRAMGVTLPTTTVVSKTLYLGVIYNSDDDKFDVVAVAQEA
jgi:hypothetical protein